MQVICPSCGEMVRSEDMNLDQMVGKCRRCHALVNLRDIVPPENFAENALRANRPRPAVPQPEKLTVEDNGSQLVISWRWFDWSVLWLIFFCIAWDSFLVFWYWMGLAVQDRVWMWFTFVFPIAHVAVGIWLTYFTLACLVNRTQISVDHEQLRVRHGPLPWPGNVVLPAPEIVQVYVSAAHACEPAPDDPGCTVNQSSSCTLKIILHDGTGRKLLSLSEPDMAMFIEQAIEKFLGLGDEPVAGELPR